jgi:hypothetical protein
VGKADADATQLKGNVTTTIVERGLITAQQKLRLFSHSTTLYSSSSFSALPTETEISIPIPPTVELKGYPVELPPSLSVYHPGISCEITYVLRIDMVRKGFRRNERCVNHKHKGFRRRGLIQEAG